jgi:hypothetical protein
MHYNFELYSILIIVNFVAVYGSLRHTPFQYELTSFTNSLSRIDTRLPDSVEDEPLGASFSFFSFLVNVIIVRLCVSKRERIESDTYELFIILAMH